ncbi:hypothetical protein ONE63_000071 [Megalurothrips usitatus]|uniref:DUF4806 domain-containing protein n=1 Tax=Megalurothrips usitatus TaxID=439358 RepID=A0AAV7Y3H1_9NEOP|nr:hypothetical protein ONE63_000071 [Megalurothrips usitatus]
MHKNIFDVLEASGGKGPSSSIDDLDLDVEEDLPDAFVKGNTLEEDQRKAAERLQDRESVNSGSQTEHPVGDLDDVPGIHTNLLKILKKIREEQERSRRHLQNLDTKISKILDILQSGENAPKPPGWPSLPLANRDQFHEFEVSMRDEGFYNFAVSHLSVIAGSGKDEREMAISVCKLLFSVELAKTLNWKGSAKKRGIEKLKCGTLILEAVGKQYEGRHSKSKVTGAISDWLRSKA